MYASEDDIQPGDAYDRETVMAQCISSLDELENYVPLDEGQRTRLQAIINEHPLLVTKYYMSLIDWTYPDDPIRKMVIPSLEEESIFGSYDTSGEEQNTIKIGIQHKYSQTALILTTNRCLAYCRFCFRKRLVGLSEKEILSNIEEAREYIENNSSITNVLLSGGDPLVLNNNIIRHLLESFTSIDHVRYVRFGSRVPVVYPTRFKDPELISLFKKYSSPTKRVHVVTHFNHPNEITDESITGIDALMRAGVDIHNQTVLLKGVNDDPKVLSNLFLSLTSIGIAPYYLFQCRPVCSVTHFQVPIETALDIVRDTRRMLDGLSKRFRFVMSHLEGKIEVVAKDDTNVYFRFHQAKDASRCGEFFHCPRNPEAYWLDDYY